MWESYWEHVDTRSAKFGDNSQLNQQKLIGICLQCVQHTNRIIQLFMHLHASPIQQQIAQTSKLLINTVLICTTIWDAISIAIVLKHNLLPVRSVIISKHCGSLSLSLSVHICKLSICLSVIGVWYLHTLVVLYLWRKYDFMVRHRAVQLIEFHLQLRFWFPTI